MIDAPDDLTQFLRWWLDGRRMLVPFDRPVVFDGGVTGVTLYREGPWQVQLFTLAPDSAIAAHRHPNVDSFEVGMGGQIVFSVGGEPVSDFAPTAAYDGTNPYFGKPVRVRPDVWHGAVSGPEGACFLSVQQWLNGVAPSNVGDDWEFEDRNDAERNRPIA